jgi:hypothetical protein
VPVLSPAAALVAVPGALLSHEEAARQVGIELVSDPGVHRLSVGRNRSRVSLKGWEVHRVDVPEDQQLVLPSGLRVTAPARTVADLGRVLPLDHAVAAGDSALRQGLVTEATLLHVLTATRGRGAPTLRLLAALLDPRSGSVLESLFRVLVLQSGLPDPRSQYVISDGRRFQARVDFCWVAERLVVELDGYAFHNDRLSYRRDRERLNGLERLGWRVLRFTWEDVVGRPEHVLALLQDVLALAA